MTMQEQMEADVLATENDGGFQFLFQGKPFIAQRTPVVGKLAMADSGFEANFDFTMEVRLSQFVSPLRAPVNEDVIQINDVDYRIVGSSPDQYGIVNHYAVKQN
jgi:hypothetical protein